VLADQQGRNTKHTMVNKREKYKGTNTKAEVTAPKRRVATKAEPAVRIAEAKPAAKTTKTAKAKTPKLRPFSQHDIALRAYFIAEKRQQSGLSGDSTSDWVEAEAELLREQRTSGLN